MSPRTDMKKGAVIGAGIAGLSCASQLRSVGVSVDIFEKSRGPSGRMSTRQTSEWSADHGAQYFTARDPRFIQEVGEWLKNGVAAIWSPRLRVYEAGAWNESHSQESRYVGIPKMSSPGKYLAKDLSIQYEKTISKLGRKEDSWTLHCLESGEIMGSYDFVVLALPAPQTRALAGNIDPQITSITSLSQMKACWTMMAHFPNPVTKDFDAAFINQEIISWIAQNSSKPMRQGQPVWTIHGSPDWSQAHVELSKEDAQAQMMECLTRLGFHTQDAEISMHRWRYASGGLESPVDFLLLPEIGLGLCGDWLHGGRVEGAWLSGLKLAEALAAQRKSAAN